MADPKGEGVKVGFDGSIRLEFHGAKVTSDAGLLAYRDLDEALGLFDSVPFVFHDSRTGRNIQHHLTALLRQSVYSRLAVMKMSTMPIVCRLIRRCGGSPERSSTIRMPPAPTRWVDSRPRCCPSRTTSKPSKTFLTSPKHLEPRPSWPLVGPP